MRLKRGTLNGAKIAGRWIVYLEATEQPPTFDRTTVQTATEQAPKQPTERDQTNVIAVYESLVTTQQDEIAFLREQLDQRSRELAVERERADTITQMALLRIEALTTGSLQTDSSDETGDTGQDRRTSPTMAQDRPDPHESTPDTAHESSHVAGWLRRLFGRT
jgi:hypothetical protein